MMNKLDVDPIKAKYFYRNAKEKIKLNWFCYEYAFIFYSKLRNDAKFKKYRRNTSQEEIVDFCVTFTKKLKKSMYEKLGGLVDTMTIYEEYVSDYYPENTSKENLLFLNAAQQAWSQLLDSCVVCPNRCISERNRACVMFDELD